MTVGDRAGGSNTNETPEKLYSSSTLTSGLSVGCAGFRGLNSIATHTGDPDARSVDTLMIR